MAYKPIPNLKSCYLGEVEDPIVIDQETANILLIALEDLVEFINALWQCEDLNGYYANRIAETPKDMDKKVAANRAITEARTYVVYARHYAYSAIKQAREGKAPYEPQEEI